MGSRWGGVVGKGFRYPPGLPSLAINQLSSPQDHHTMKETFVSSFTHMSSAIITAPSILPASGLTFMHLTELETSRYNPDHVLVNCLCEKKVHECTNIIQQSNGFHLLYNPFSFITE